MKQLSKNATTDRAVEKTLTKMRQLLGHKDLREFSLQSSGQGTRFTITVGRKVSSFWLPNRYVFKRELQEMFARAVAQSEQHET